MPCSLFLSFSPSLCLTYLSLGTTCDSVCVTISALPCGSFALSFLKASMIVSSFGRAYGSLQRKEPAPSRMKQPLSAEVGDQLRMQWPRHLKATPTGATLNLSISTM